jgi:DUF1365 family protein
MSMETALYTGYVRHTRVSQRKLSLHHRCFWVSLDVDRIDEIVSKLSILSHGRFNILGIYDRDYGDGSDRPLREQIEQHLTTAGIESRAAKIVLFSMPRVLGYGFNPISLYFCMDETGAPAAIVYEVHNTFGQRHSYVARVEQDSETIVQSAGKTFYVSPFMDMDLSYKFRIVITAGKFNLAISAYQQDKPVIFTSLHARRSELDNCNLLKAWIAHPLLTVKVIAAIHFHALRLWLKGIKLRLRPAPPSVPVTIGETRKQLS